MSASGAQTAKQMLYEAFRQVIPAREDQIVLTNAEIPQAFAYLIPLLLMAYLSRRSDTHLIRISLLPITVILCLKGTFSYIGDDPEQVPLTWTRGTTALRFLSLAIDLACTPEGRLKSGEKDLPPMGQSSSWRKQKGHTQDIKTSTPIWSWILPQCILDSLEVLFTPRGIKWQFNEGVPVPKEFRSLQRGRYIFRTIGWIILDLVQMEVMHTVLDLFPKLTDIGGGSIFYPTLPPVQRYLTSTLLTIAFAQSTILSLQASYNIAAVLAVALGQSPSEWPPFFVNPWGATSLHDFWGARWHQQLRRNVLILAGFPGRHIAGRLGMLFGAFLASGLLHELAAYTVPKPLDHRVTYFFLLQAVGMLLEETYQHITGKKVGGIGGRIMSLVFVFGFGQLLVDAWMIMGISSNPGPLPMLNPFKMYLSATLKDTIRQWIEA